MSTTPQDEHRGMPDAPAVVSNDPGSFPWGVLHRRHPALIRQVDGACPYPPEHQRALHRLLDEITTGKIEPLPAQAHDRADWDRWGGDCIGEQWPDVPFLWAESYFYRKLLGAVGYFGPGPWRGIDPFAPQKSAELADPDLDTELASLDDLAGLARRDRRQALGYAALWGNYADLGFRTTEPDPDPDAGDRGRQPDPGDRDRQPDLVSDDSALLWQHLDAAGPGPVCVVADNAGRELLFDLALVDHLLETGAATHVELHVKPSPYYVSDATTADLAACMRRLTAAPGTAGDVGQRLWQASNSGRLTVHTHAFYCAPFSYHHMPDDLAERFAAARLTVMKGDLNYRRLVGDRHWPATASFAALTAHFPGPVAALRILKSDVAAGIDGDTLAALETTSPAWRTSGTHALIQARV